MVEQNEHERVKSRATNCDHRTGLKVPVGDEEREKKLVANHVHKWKWKAAELAVHMPPLSCHVMLFCIAIHDTCNSTKS